MSRDRSVMISASAYRVLAVAALVAAVAVPNASAKPGARRASGCPTWTCQTRRLSVLPLPAAVIGSAAKALRLQHDSGYPYDNGNLAGLPVTPNRAVIPVGPGLEQLGRLTGYALDYGLGASGGAGVTEVRTSVDLYTTRADAKKGLAFWKSNDRRVTRYAGGGLAITRRGEKVAPVGGRRFAFLVGYSAANIAPLFGVDEQFTEGRYEADVSVWAGTAAAAEQLAPTLAKKLDARIKLTLAGRLHAKRVKLPAKQKAQRAPGGPDLSPLALKPTDVGGQGTFLDSYFVGDDPFALSYFKVLIFPKAGPFYAVGQEIEWFATANQASYTADVDTASFGSASLDLSGVGDGAKAALGGTYAAMYFSSGHLMEFVQLQSQSSPIQASNVRQVAQTAANYIDSAGLGS